MCIHAPTSRGHVNKPVTSTPFHRHFLILSTPTLVARPRLAVTLFGPGPANRDGRPHQDGETMSRGEPTVLFADFNAAKNTYYADFAAGVCTAGMGPGLTFSDSAEQHVRACCEYGR